MVCVCEKYCKMRPAFETWFLTRYQKQSNQNPKVFTNLLISREKSQTHHCQYCGGIEWIFCTSGAVKIENQLKYNETHLNEHD